MSKYYFLASVLPALDPNLPLPVSFEQLIDQLKVGLSSKDFEQVDLYLSWKDRLALRDFFWGDPIDSRSHFQSAQELETAIGTGDGLDPDVLEFLDAFPTILERRRFAPSLLVTFFQGKALKARGILKDFFAFEREWQLVITAWKAFKYGKNLAVELQFEDPHDPFVAELLSNQGRGSFVFPFKYEELEPLFKDLNDPTQLEKKLLDYRYHRCDLFSETSPFSLDTLIGYLIQLSICKDFFNLSTPHGKMWAELTMKEQAHVKFTFPAR